MEIRREKSFVIDDMVVAYTAADVISLVIARGSDRPVSNLYPRGIVAARRIFNTRFERRAVRLRADGVNVSANVNGIRIRTARTKNRGTAVNGIALSHRAEVK